MHLQRANGLSCSAISAIVCVARLPQGGVRRRQPLCSEYRAVRQQETIDQLGKSNYLARSEASRRYSNPARRCHRREEYHSTELNPAEAGTRSSAGCDSGRKTSIVA